MAPGGSRHSQSCALAAILLLCALAPARAELVTALRSEVRVQPAGSVTLQSFVRQADLRTLVLGGLPPKPYRFSVAGRMAGDRLEDMCETLGYTWRRVGNWCVLEGMPGSPSAEAPELVRWLQGNAGVTTYSFDQLLWLSGYDPEVLHGLTGEYPALARVTQDQWKALRFLRQLTADQRRTLEQGGLKISDLATQSSAALWDALVSTSGFVGSVPAEMILRMERKDRDDGQVQRTVTWTDGDITHTLLSVTTQESGPETAAAAGDAPVGDARKRPDGFADLFVAGWTTEQLLNWMNTQWSLKLTVEEALAKGRIAISAQGVSADDIRTALASAFDADWREEEGGSALLSPSPEATRRAKKRVEARQRERLQNDQTFLDNLVEGVRLSDAKLGLLALSDMELYGQLYRRNTTRGAVEAYAALPQQVRTVIKTSGSWRGRCAELPPSVRAGLAQAVSGLKMNEAPLIEPESLSQPDAVVEFRSASDRVNVTVWTPAVPGGFSQSFGRNTGLSYPNSTHFAVKPWYLRRPRSVPPEYVEHLKDVRKWRGGLSLRYLAPLAFVPASARRAIKEAVPEVERISRANEPFLQLFAALDPDQRRKIESSDGLAPTDLKGGAYFALLGIAGYPGVKVTKSDFAASRLRLVPLAGGGEMDREFRYTIGTRTIRAATRKPESRQ